MRRPGRDGVTLTLSPLMAKPADRAGRRMGAKVGRTAAVTAAGSSSTWMPSLVTGKRRAPRSWARVMRAVRPAPITVDRVGGQALGLRAGGGGVGVAHRGGDRGHGHRDGGRQRGQAPLQLDRVDPLPRPRRGGHDGVVLHLHAWPPGPGCPPSRPPGPPPPGRAPASARQSRVTSRPLARPSSARMRPNRDGSFTASATAASTCGYGRQARVAHPQREVGVARPHDGDRPRGGLGGGQHRPARLVGREAAHRDPVDRHPGGHLVGGRREQPNRDHGRPAHEHDQRRDEGDQGLGTSRSGQAHDRRVCQPGPWTRTTLGPR